MSATMNACSPRVRSRRRIATAVILGIFAAATFASGDARAEAPQKPSDAKGSSRTPYQAYLAADCLPGSNFCKFVSEEVAVLTQLEIHRVACQGWHISTMVPSFVVIAELRTSADGFVKRIDFLEARYAPANGGSVWAISEPTLMFIPAGHKLRIELNSATTGVGSYGCTISGYLTPAD